MVKEATMEEWQAAWDLMFPLTPPPERIRNTSGFPCFGISNNVRPQVTAAASESSEG